jgi:hypothetical protein
MRGLSEPNGSWKIIWISARSGCSSAAGRVAIEDLAAGRVDGAQDAARGGGLAAARFADQAQRLALVQGEVDPVDGADMTDGALEEALGDGEEFLEAAHLEQRLFHSASALSWCRKQLAS